MTRKYFGTDGIRGPVGEFPITPDFVLKLGYAAGKVFARRTDKRNCVIIGKDTRISGYMFESALEAGLVAAGVDVRLLGPMPTPAIAYLTKTFSCAAGIVISASHNPYYDNGIKFFSDTGSKLADDIELEIEAELEKEIVTVASNEIGKVKRVNDAAGRYIEYCKSTLPPYFNLSGLRIVIDCAHGATYFVAPKVFLELGAEVISIGTDPDGLNINENFGSTSPKNLQNAVIREKADFGIAFDGDGDRVCFVDRFGEVLDGDELVYIIAKNKVEQGEKLDGVVGTLMTNYGFEKAMQKLDIPFVRANVGDRYVKELMLEKGWQIGGESSGHIICSNVSTTGDGIVSALQVLKAVVDSGSKLHELKQGMNKMPQVMINVRDVDKSGLNKDAVQAAVSQTEEQLAGTGRVLLRPSGTEPVVRVMIEGENGEQVQQLCEQLAGTIEKELS